MAYMRGDYYLWSDTEDWLHIWVADGYDGWDEAGWATDEEGEHRGEGKENASGVSLPERVMDEYVVMRLAEMLLEGKVEGAIERALVSGNNGGRALKKNAARLKDALAEIKLEQPDAL